MLNKLCELERLACIAAKYVMLQADDEDGFLSLHYSKLGALKQIQRESGIELDLDKILKEWEDEDYQTERKRHKCPVCQKLMVKRKNKKTGREFWGCESFTESKHKLYYQNRKKRSIISGVDDDNNYWDAMDNYFSMDFDNGF